MAEFCEMCYKEWGMQADIRIRSYVRKLKPSEFINVICEGCGYYGIRRDESNNYFFLYDEREEEVPKEYINNWIIRLINKVV